MATIHEIADYLDALLPRSLSCEWDNDGVMVCADPNTEVKTILFTLDVTPDAIAYAELIGAELILSHHPLIFKGIKHMDGNDITSKKVLRLLKSGISVMSYHTRLDAAEGGVNDILAQTLGLTQIVPFDTEDGPIGRIGTLPHEMHFDDFCLMAKQALGAPHFTASKGKDTVRRVAVLGGSGRDYITDAMRAGADLYLTGEANYHSLMDAAEMNFSVVTAGHDFTENAFFRFFEKTLCADFPGITCRTSPIPCALYHV